MTGLISNALRARKSWSIRSISLLGTAELELVYKNTRGEERPYSNSKPNASVKIPFGPPGKCESYQIGTGWSAMSGVMLTPVVLISYNSRHNRPYLLTQLCGTELNYVIHHCCCGQHWAGWQGEKDQWWHSHWQIYAVCRSIMWYQWLELHHANKKCEKAICTLPIVPTNPGKKKLRGGIKSHSSFSKDWLPWLFASVVLVANMISKLWIGGCNETPDVVHHQLWTYTRVVTRVVVTVEKVI